MDEPEGLEAFDPDCVFRSLALAMAVMSDTSKDEQKIMARAQSFYDFIDPFALSAETFKLTLERK